MTDRVELKPPETDDPAEGEQVIAEGLTYDEFRERFADQHVEWVVGKVIAREMKNKKHQMLLGFLYRLLSYFVDLKQLGEVYLEGISMYVGDDKPAREPDIVVLLNHKLDRMKDTYLDGPADFCIEIVSPESVNHDRVKKVKEYEAAGVPEYWIFDVTVQEVLAYALDENGHYQLLEPEDNGRIASKILPGFAIDPGMMWRDKLPDTGEIEALVKAML